MRSGRLLRGGVAHRDAEVSMKQRRTPEAHVTRKSARRVILALAIVVAMIAAPPRPGASEPATLAIDFRNTETLYAATLRGIFKSVDGGATWAPRNAGLQIAERPFFATALVMDPTNSRTLYVANMDGGLFRTTDGADTWVQIRRTLPALTAFAVDPKTPTVLYS